MVKSAPAVNALTFGRPGDPPPAKTLTTGTLTESTELDALKDGKMYLIQPLTVKDKFWGTLQKYDISPWYVVGLIALPLLGSLGLVLLVKTASAILAAKVLAGVGLVATVYQIYVCVAQHKELAAYREKTSEHEIGKFWFHSDKIKHAGQFNEFLWALNKALKTNKYDYLKSAANYMKLEGVDETAALTKTLDIPEVQANPVIKAMLQAILARNMNSEGRGLDDKKS